MENVNLNETVQQQFDTEMRIANEAAQRMHELTHPTFLGNKANLVGMLAGTVAATALEFSSRNGTTASIVSTGLTGLVLTAASAKNLSIIPNTAGTAVSAGVATFAVSRCVGRSVAEYFPPEEETKEEVVA